MNCFRFMHNSNLMSLKKSINKTISIVSKSSVDTLLNLNWNLNDICQLMSNWYSISSLIRFRCLNKSLAIEVGGHSAINPDTDIHVYIVFISRSNHCYWEKN